MLCMEEGCESEAQFSRKIVVAGEREFIAYCYPHAISNEVMADNADDPPPEPE